MATTEFRQELESLINRHSMENASNTPDWILADYLAACLDALQQGHHLGLGVHNGQADRRHP